MSGSDAASAIVTGLLSILVAGCVGPDLPPAPVVAGIGDAPYYRIGPGDELDVFVWRNDDLNTRLRVRPDGRISFPLIGELTAAGKTPADLGDDIGQRLATYIREPNVAVMMTSFSGTFDQQVRVIGEAQKPQAIPYRDKMTVLDVMIAVGGLTEFASGNRAVVARGAGSQQQEYRVRLDDLVRDGDISANVEMLPGDILIIPQRYL
jgi:polysaccharide export outer membrane protein